MNSFWLLLFIILALSKKNGYITVPNRPFWLFQRGYEFHYIFGIFIYRVARVLQITTFTTKTPINVCCPCYKTLSITPTFCSKQSIFSAAMIPPSSLRNILVVLHIYKYVFSWLENAGILLSNNFCLELVGKDLYNILPEWEIWFFQIAIDLSSALLV